MANGFVLPLNFLLLVFVALGCASTPRAAAVGLDGIDVFGSRHVSESEILSRFRSPVENLSRLSESDIDAFWGLKKAIETEIRRSFGFAFVEISIVTYFNPSARFATIDVVEIEDAKERMSFSQAPTEEFADPEGLIALWNEYQSAGFELQRRGELPAVASCPVWHCIFGFEHPALKPYLLLLNQGTRRQERKLREILRQDKRADWRAAAAFLLAHGRDSAKLVSALGDALSDPSALVRNNALRVYVGILSKDSSISIPLDPILRALRFPLTTDRNKAGYVLAFLSRHPTNHEKIRRVAGSTLLEMLRLRQPNNRDPAYEVLKNISGLEIPATDLAAWERWMRGTPRS